MGLPHTDAAMLRAVRDRFRPIVLSSVTTLVGLTPLIFNTSIHAAAMQPVAISVGFGMLFSIVVMPCAWAGIWGSAMTFR